MRRYSIALALTASFCCLSAVAQPTGPADTTPALAPVAGESTELDDRQLQLLAGGGKYISPRAGNQSGKPSQPGSGGGYRGGCNRAQNCR